VGKNVVTSKDEEDKHRKTTKKEEDLLFDSFLESLTLDFDFADHSFPILSCRFLAACHVC